MITVYTAVVDGFDNLRAPLVQPSPGIRYICYTNVPFQPAVDPWEFRPVHPVAWNRRFSASATSRLPKILPHLLLPADTSISIWHDGNFQLQMEPCEIVARCLRPDVDWAAHRHPARDCVYEEATILQGGEDGSGRRIGDQTGLRIELNRLRLAGHPEHFGLWANGFIVRRHTAKVADACEAWWKLFSDGSGRDQISLPMVARSLSLPVNTLDENVYLSPYVKFNFHAPWRHRDDNPDFEGQRNHIHSRTQRLAAIAGDGGYEYPVRWPQ